MILKLLLNVWFAEKMNRFVSVSGNQSRGWTIGGRQFYTGFCQLARLSTQRISLSEYFLVELNALSVFLGVHSTYIVRIQRKIPHNTQNFWFARFVFRGGILHAFCVTLFQEPCL